MLRYSPFLREGQRARGAAFYLCRPFCGTMGRHLVFMATPQTAPSNPRSVHMQIRIKSLGVSSSWLVALRRSSNLLFRSREFLPSPSQEEFSTSSLASFVLFNADPSICPDYILKTIDPWLPSACSLCSLHLDAVSSGYLQGPEMQLLRVVKIKQRREGGWRIIVDACVAVLGNIVRFQGVRSQGLNVEIYLQYSTKMLTGSRIFKKQILQWVSAYLMFEILFIVVS